MEGTEAVQSDRAIGSGTGSDTVPRSPRAGGTLETEVRDALDALSNGDGSARSTALRAISRFRLDPILADRAAELRATVFSTAQSDAIDANRVEAYRTLLLDRNWESDYQDAIAALRSEPNPTVVREVLGIVSQRYDRRAWYLAQPLPDESLVESANRLRTFLAEMQALAEHLKCISDDRLDQAYALTSSRQFARADAELTEYIASHR